MIRLSEAMARLHCQEEVKPKHVKEAFRLLNKSIIRVETPDINFDDDEDQEQHLENGGETLSAVTEPRVLPTTFLYIQSMYMYAMCFISNTINPVFV